MEREQKIRLIFTSRLSGMMIVEEEMKGKSETNIIKDISFSQGISIFPTSKLEINPTNKYPNLISIKSGDEVQIFVAELDKPFNKLFQGILSSVKIKATRENFELILESVSAFYSLQIKKINYQNFKTRNGLREVLNELVQIYGINGKIEVDDNIDNEFILTPFKSFPGLSFINAICYDLDLVYDFNKGDIMRISKRIDFLDKLHSAIPIVLDNYKIISSEFEQ
jgi:hypothetical protein